MTQQKGGVRLTQRQRARLTGDFFVLYATNVALILLCQWLAGPGL